MGYGKNLKKILYERGLTVHEVAIAAKITPTTLYSAIQKDRSVSYGNAIKLSRVLHPVIDIRTICDKVPNDDPTLHRTSLCDYLKVAEKMKAARSETGLGIEEIANLMNLSPESYEDYENGNRQIPSEILLLFCSVIKKTPEQLLEIKIAPVSSEIPTPTAITFGMLRLLFNSTYGDTVIIIFDKKNDNLEIKPNHPILNAYESSEIQYITTLPGKDGQVHIAISLKQN